MRRCTCIGVRVSVCVRERERRAERDYVRKTTKNGQGVLLHLRCGILVLEQIETDLHTVHVENLLRILGLESQGSEKLKIVLSLRNWSGTVGHGSHETLDVLSSDLVDDLTSDELNRGIIGIRRKSSHNVLKSITLIHHLDVLDVVTHKFSQGVELSSYLVVFARFVTSF